MENKNNEKMISYISDFNNFLKDKIPREPKEIFLDLEEYIFRGGKRIRPLLMFSVGECFGIRKEELYDYAAVVEMFHNFTLIHDDIEDNSKLRRGKPTLHIKYGVPLALNLGDAFYTYIWNYLIEKTREDNKELINKIRKSFTKVVEGQGYELYWIKNDLYDVGEEGYFRMAEGKTASLIATSMAVGALNNEESALIEKAGINLGLSFQIIDDYLNLFGNQKKYGKTIGDDITEGKRTLMVVHALETLNEKDKERLIDILKEHSDDKKMINEAISLIKKNNSHTYAKNKAEELYKEAIEILNKLPNNEFLLYLSSLIINRDH